MIRVRLIEDGLCIVSYAPTWFWRLLGGHETDRVATEHRGAWHYDSTGRAVEAHVAHEINKALRIATVQSRIAALTNNTH